MELQEATRKSFPVKVIQVTLQNIDEVAEWCKGAIEMRPTKMMGTTTDLPVIKIEGVGTERGKIFEAALGCWVVEFKGSFRSFKPAQFDSSFDIVPPKVDEIPTYKVVDDVTAEPINDAAAEEQIAEDSGIYNSGFKLVSGDDR